MTFIGYVESQSIVVPSLITVSATNNGGGPTAVTITAGTYSISSFCTHLQTQLNAQRAGSAGATWTVSLSTTTGLVTISMSAGNFSISWTSTDMRDLLGFAANITTVTSATGTKQVHGLWIPDCTLVADGDTKRAPTTTMVSENESPTGIGYTWIGPRKREHTNLKWSHVAINRMWEAEATTSNASYETFHNDAFDNAGHAWFTSPDRKVKIVEHRSATVGTDVSSSQTWYVRQAPNLSQLRMAVDQYTGLWTVQWPRIIAAV